jgi:hypothetical protein
LFLNLKGFYILCKINYISKLGKMNAIQSPSQPPMGIGDGIGDILYCSCQGKSDGDIKSVSYNFPPVLGILRLSVPVGTL